VTRDRIIAIVVWLMAGSVAFVAIAYGAYVLIYGQTLEPPASTTLATAVGGMIGILGAYIGGKP
jgi:hypothetical protein